MLKNHLKEKLDSLYLIYNHKFSSKDPVRNLNRFSDEKDIEIAGLITSAYTYGSVDQINMFINRVLDITGNKPYEFTINFEKRKDKKHLKGLNYRFNSDDDLAELFSALKKMLITHSSLKNAFMKHFTSADENILPALTGFTGELNRGCKTPDYNSFNYLLPTPARGSACKRMNLFLRWMVRKDEIDFGLWREINTSKLIMPVDVHISRVSKKLGLVSRSSPELKFAIELTRKLKEFDPIDPVKYDFSLCHIGIDKKDLENML